MKITISIDGRDAIPVRAIPLITGWHLSPDVIAHTFARCGDGHDWRLRGISAYMQDSTNGKTLRVEPDTWGPYCIALESLDAQLQEGVEGKEDWRQQSVSKLPARAFVWSDEFEIAYRADLDKEARGLGEDWPAQADVFVWPSESYCAMHFSEIEMLTEGFGSSQVAEMAPPQKPIEEERGCRRLIREHWLEIRSLYGPGADARQVERFIRKNVDPDQDPPKLKTVQNVLIDLRKEGLLP